MYVIVKLNLYFKNLTDVLPSILFMCQNRKMSFTFCLISFLLDAVPLVPFLIYEGRETFCNSRYLSGKANFWNFQWVNIIIEHFFASFESHSHELLNINTSLFRFLFPHFSCVNSDIVNVCRKGLGIWDEQPQCI